MAASVLDASALLALFGDEPGAEAVAEALQEGVALSAVNLAELLSKLAAEGVEPERALERIEAITDALEVHGLERADLIEIARLRPITRQRGLSLADRACLALARRLGLPALTADRAWADLLPVEVEIVLIR